jgi:hypothetical protein
LGGWYAVKGGQIVIELGTHLLKEQDSVEELEAHIHPLVARPLVKSVYPYPLKGIVESFVSRKDVRL